MDETLFYVFGIALVCSALVLSAIGLRSRSFPPSRIVLAGVVAVGNVIGLAPSQMPIAMIAVVVLGAFALLAAGVVVLSGVARSSKPAA